MTVYRWVRRGKVETVNIFGRRVIPLIELQPYVVPRCSNCYHQQQGNGTFHCACRTIEDIKDGCTDWTWKWNSSHS